MFIMDGVGQQFKGSGNKRPSVLDTAHVDAIYEVHAYFFNQLLKVKHGRKIKN